LSKENSFSLKVARLATVWLRKVHLMVHRLSVLALLL
jgi:hypothetical protein